jgi:small-conductance mechanosensitive channel
MLADLEPAGVIDQAIRALTGWTDATSTREAILAVAALTLFLLTAPRGRRRLAILPLVFLGLALVELAAVAVFPPLRDRGGPGQPSAHYLLRFFLIASLLESVLLLLMVTAWERMAGPASRIFLDILRAAMLTVALFVVMWDAGIDAGGLLTGSAVVTAVLGFALRDTLGNVFAGLAIQTERPFEVGDWIQYDANQAHIGRVVEVNWRATKVITLDEAYVVIPNGQLAQASIRNFTKPEPWSRRSLFVITPFDVSPQRVQRVILEAIRGSFGVLEHPPASVVTNAFTDRGVEHWVRFFTTDFDKRDRVDGMARDRIWFALSREGIEIPTATQSIRLTQTHPPEPCESAEEETARHVASLRRVGLLGSLAPEHVRRLAEGAREVCFAAGEPVIRQGDPGASMFVVLDGAVEVSAAGPGTPAAALARLGAGEYFGEMSLLTGAPRSATVVPAVETRLLEVGKEAVREVLDGHPELLASLSAALERRLAERSRAIAAGGPAPVPAPHDLLRTIRDFFAS